MLNARENHSELSQHFQRGFDFAFHGSYPLGIHRVSAGPWHQMPQNGAILYNWIDYLVPISCLEK